MKKSITDWENDLRSLGYDNKDIIAITMKIIDMYEYGRSQRPGLKNRIVRWFRTIFK